jgi:hypothetical protein
MSSNFVDHRRHVVEVEVQEIVRYDVINEKVSWQIGNVQGLRQLLGVYCRECNEEIDDVTLVYDEEIDFSVIRMKEEE